MEWITVYDFGNESLRIGWMMILISFVLLGYGLSARSILSKRSTDCRKKQNFLFGLFFGTFSLLFGLAIIPNNIVNYCRTKKIYESQRYQVVEGVVKNFVPMPYSGHQNESFTLNSAILILTGATMDLITLNHMVGQ